MAGKGQYRWTTELQNQLRNDVNAHVTAGLSKTAAYTKVASTWKISPTYISKLCLYDLHELTNIRRKNYKRTQSRRLANSTATSSAPRTPRPATQGMTMSIAEAREFYNFCRQLSNFGITIS
jgi:hypothetical protein